MSVPPLTDSSKKKTKNIVISGTNFWNPGDDFVRDGIIRILRRLFKEYALNFLFYNFNQDFYPQSKFSGVHNMAAAGDLNKYGEFVDAVVVAGLSAGKEIKDLYNWVIENRLLDRVFLIGAGYANPYVDKNISQEPEATVFRNARIITGRTEKKPGFITQLGLPYYHINCPAMLSVEQTKAVPAGKGVETIGFSIQLPHRVGVVNHSCDASMYKLAAHTLLELSPKYKVEIIAHHKEEYFHFLNLFKGHDIPVFFSSFYQDLFEVYRRYDLVVSTRLHACIYANSHGIPAVIINDTDRHTHCAEGFPHLAWVNTKEKFHGELERICRGDLRQTAKDNQQFKDKLMRQYLTVLAGPFGISAPQKETPLFDKLNIGCGCDYRQGFVNIDGNPDLSKVDYVLDIKPGTLLEHFEPGSFNYILARDFLEHHFHWEARSLLEDFHALLGSKGQLEIRLPNIEGIVNDTRKDITEKVVSLYGGQDMQQRWETAGPNPSRRSYPQYFCHKYGWTPDSVKSELASVGFSPVEINDEGWNMSIIAEKRAKTSALVEGQLPMHFFTIVLNGQPFIRHHIEVFKQLPFKWHWHIIEGVADLKHDTAWSVKLGGRINEQLHRNGLSNDGTAEYIDELVRQYPENITVYRKPTGVFWDGKLEMVNAPLANITEECLLWQVDSDELWTAEQIRAARDMFVAEPARTAAFYLDHFFVGENLVTTTINTYGNNTGYEWLRTWRFRPGLRWTAHEPPRLCMQTQGKWVDIATIAPFKHHETTAKNLVFQHCAYATEKQLAFKEVYYGYKNAVEQWRRLQQNEDFPVFLRDYFAWVKDGAQVNTIQSQNIAPLARKNAEGQWQFSFCLPAPEQQITQSSKDHKKILIVRPDAIGDFVIFSGVLKHFRDLYQDAKISILTQEHIGELAQNCPYVDEAIGFNRARAMSDHQYYRDFLERLKARRFDVAINPVYSRDVVSDALTLGSGAKVTIASNGDTSNISEQQKQEHDRLYTQILPAGDVPVPETVRNVEFVRKLAQRDVDWQCVPQVWIQREDETKIDELLGDLSAKTPIVICPFSQHAIKDWPLSRWTQLVSGYRDYHILFCGSQKDIHKTDELIRTLNHDNVHNLCGRTTLRQLAALLKRSRLCITVDTAAIHIAAAVGCPQVVIAGGGHFGRFVPYSPTTTVVHLPMKCYHCNWCCKYDRARCINQIRAETVDRAVRSELESLGAARSAPVLVEETLNDDFVPAEPVTCNIEELADVDVNEVDKDNKYIVTAIVSTYNAERFVAGCLQDLENQTISNRLEIIVVDSGSKQNEQAIVREFQQKYDNIKYIRTEQRETIYKAWNRAIKIASGKYITSANTDDRHRADAIEILAKAMEKYPDKVLAYANQKKVMEAEGRRIVIGELVRGESARSRLFEGECPPGSQPIWRKEVHDVMGYFDESFFIGGDLEFWFRLTQRYDFLYVDKMLGERLVRPDAVSQSDTALVSVETMIINKCYRYASELAVTVGIAGLSEDSVFSTWPEVSLWKEAVKAKLEDRTVDYHSNVVGSIRDFRTTEKPALSVIVTTCSRPHLLWETLDSLNRQTEKNFEVILANNGPQLPDLESMTGRLAYGICCIDLIENLGPAWANNVAATHARADIVAFLDDDAVADENFVKNVVRNLSSGDMAGLRGRVLPRKDRPGSYSPAHYDLGDSRMITACGVSSNMAFRKDVFTSLGGFDPRLFGNEGVELSFRIYKSLGDRLDCILYCPDILIFHNPVEGAAYVEKSLRLQEMTRFARDWHDGFDLYEKYMRSLYPQSRTKVDKDALWLLDNSVFLQKNNPAEAVKYAERAVELEPQNMRGLHTLGSLYVRLGRYDEAQKVLEPTSVAPPRALECRDFELPGFDYRQYNETATYCLGCHTKLAQCYLKLGKYDALRQVYENLLANPRLPISEQQKTDMRSVLAKLDKVRHRRTVKERQSLVGAAVKSEQPYLVTAIVSTYNAERFMRGCLEDLEQQTIADKLEIIVVNSGSQQDEEAIIKEFQQKYANIRYIKTDRRETVYAAWNRAVRSASGKYITNANTDDRHRNDALEVMAGALDANPDVALVYGDQIRTDTPNDVFAGHNAGEMLQRPAYSRERLMLGCCVGSQPMWRKSVHDEFGYFDETLTCAGDWDFWLRISAGYNFKHTPELLGLYYYNNGGIEHGRKIHSFYERYVVGKRYGTPYISVIPLYESSSSPLVSVIMPAYNAAGYIQAAIESVLIQNYRNFEIVAVDDGSTDNTKEIIGSFKDDKIKYFYKENGGASSARNLAIKESRGEFVIALDADDMVTPDFIARHLQEFEKHPEADLIYCDDYLIDKDEKPLRVIERPEYADRRLLIRDLFRSGFPVVPFRTCIRRSVFDKIGFYDTALSVAEDYDMLRKFLKHGLNLYHLKAALYLRRMTVNSLSRDYNAGNADSHFEVVRRFIDTFTCEELFPDISWDGMSPEVRRPHAKCLVAVTYLAIAQAYIRSNSPVYADTAFKCARAELNDCLRLDPENGRVRQLLQQCESVRAACGQAAKKSVCV
ncbi:MAG: glycosyltransferase [Planctomycetota bacterium]|jgi:glycosyltransferase involved in cell wall biosynthesis/ADP-heptose:LPS heptosyltransferase